MSESQAENIQFLTFKLGAEVYGVDVLQVREVLDAVPVTKVPRSPEYMLGVINLRGSVVPVVDMRRKFGMASAEKNRDNCIVVMEIALEGETAVIGALADAVEEVLELSAGQIEPAPKLGTRLNTEFIRGMGKRDEQFIILLEVDRIFSADELTVVAGAAEPAKD